MDLEEELSSIQQQQDIFNHNNEGGNLPAEGDDDLLGLDKQIKLTSRAKIAKIDNERIFDKQKGINYIINNYSKVSRTFKKNDKKLAKRLSMNPQYSSKIKKQLKQENEFENLSAVLQFYQLWCHGIFPKARFKDCLHLIRSLGTKSSQLKMYRRELFDLEINKLKVKNGIIDGSVAENDNNISEGNNVNDAIQVENEPNHDVGSSSAVDNDDDWSFMNVNRSSTNNLFIGDDDIDQDDLYSAPSAPIINSIPVANTNYSPITSENPKKVLVSPLSENENESEDPFSDNDEIILQNNSISNRPVNMQNSIEEFPNDDDFDEFANEMEIMEEMGL